MSTLQAEDLKVSLKKDFIKLMSEIDKQNVDYVEKAMHDDYHDSFVFKGSPGAISSTKKDYVKFLSEGKIGGMDRKVEISSLEIMDQFGIVKSKLESKVMKFDGNFTFYLNGKTWVLIKSIIVAEKK
ncbi:nuclear transport factor 2 family protein [Leptospira sp. GIMC2001]|uniref:nuclear transport factor 2 family protein n=1 Tax=Leptospira sp. GIMC2001 TaxID=1513297 RepID=UPI00234A66C2|nr:nuclear transport factor 2 family protein [Leptospira sp. GIMC2001]WCL49209.1 nuclear transport factor 2 family protein [Leptospira sp. GIMC2001]